MWRVRRFRYLRPKKTHRIQKPVKLKTLKLSKNIQIPKKTNFTQILSKEPKISTIVSEYQRYILKIFLKLETITKTRTQNLKKKISIYIYIYVYIYWKYIWNTQIYIMYIKYFGYLGTRCQIETHESKKI